MKTLKITLLLCACGILGAASSPKPTSRPWKLGAQTYTFHLFTFVQTLDKMQSLGLRHAEVFFGQPLGEGFGDATMDYNMDRATIKRVRQAAKAKGVTIEAGGVVICDSEDEWHTLFRFAKDMGMSLITCEPRAEHLDAVERLSDRYKVDVAIHNHPKPSSYWSPDAVMKALEGRSPRIGVCADVGHWKREGIVPVQALRQVGGRLKSLHFKDVAATRHRRAGAARCDLGHGSMRCTDHDRSAPKCRIQWINVDRIRVQLGKFPTRH